MSSNVVPDTLLKVFVPGGLPPSVPLPLPPPPRPSAWLWQSRHPRAGKQRHLQTHRQWVTAPSGKGPKIKKRESIVFDHTPPPPPPLTLENIFKVNSKTQK